MLVRLQLTVNDVDLSAADLAQVRAWLSAHCPDPTTYDFQVFKLVPVETYQSGDKVPV
jgi:hypothetical protein